MINRSPSAALNFKVPKEVRSRKVPDYMHVRVFGCTAYAHVSQGKLEPRAKKCIFMGYPDGVKGYKLWYRERGVSKILISRDVVFREDQMFMGGDKDTEPVPDMPDVQTCSKQVELSLQDVATQQIELEADQEEQESIAHEELSDYQLARDRSRRQVRPPTRYAEVEIVSFALNIA